jgi:hypothetical protein
VPSELPPTCTRKDLIYGIKHHTTVSAQKRQRVNALGDGQNARVLKMEIRRFPGVFECSRVLKVAIGAHELV